MQWWVRIPYKITAGEPGLCFLVVLLPAAALGLMGWLRKPAHQSETLQEPEQVCRQDGARHHLPPVLLGRL